MQVLALWYSDFVSIIAIPQLIQYGGRCIRRAHLKQRWPSDVCVEPTAVKVFPKFWEPIAYTYSHAGRRPNEHSDRAFVLDTILAYVRVHRLQIFGMNKTMPAGRLWLVYIIPHIYCEISNLLTSRYAMPIARGIRLLTDGCNAYNHEAKRIQTPPRKVSRH